MKVRLWSRNYVFALAVGFFLSMVFYMLMTSMALFAAREFGAGELLAGLASSIFVIGAVVARLFAGMVLQRMGLRRALLVALVISTVVTLAYFTAETLVLLLVVRFVHGVMFGFAHTAASAIVQSLIPPSRRGEGTGYFGATTTLATAAGPFLAVAITARGSYDGVLAATVAVTFLALSAALLLRAPAPHPRPAVPAGSTRRRTGFIERASVPISLFSLVAAIAFSGVVAFVNSFAEELHLTSAAAVFFLVYGLVVVLTRPFVGRVHDFRGDNSVMYPATIIMAAGLGMLAATSNGAMLLGAAALLGAGWGTIISAAQAIAVSRAPISQVGRAVSTFFLLTDVGMGFGPVVLGLMVGPLGFGGMYGMLAVVMLLGVGLYWALHGRKQGDRRLPGGLGEPPVG